MSAFLTFRQAVFKMIAAPLRRLPNFRGKVRVLLALYKYLGLAPYHFIVEAQLFRGKHNFRLDLHSNHELMGYLMNGYEEEVSDFLLKLLGSGKTVLDIGANIGLISIPLAVKAKFCNGDVRVYAIEAISSNADVLKHNIESNNLKKSIQAISLGVGEVEKRVDITVENNLDVGEGTGTANILPDGSDHPCARIALDITTIDSLREKGDIAENIDLIKVDVDGYDLFAMLGAKMLLTESRPIIFGEFMAYCLNWHGQRIEDVIDFMESLNYTVYAKEKSIWKFKKDFNIASYVQDVLIIPNEREEEFSWCLLE